MNQSCHTCTCTATPLPIASNISINSCSPLRGVCTSVTWHICHTCEWIMSHVNVNESCHACTCTTTPLPIANISNNSCNPLQGVCTSRTCLICHTCKWIMSHMYANESCHMYTWMNHVTYIHVLPHHYQLPATSPWVRAALCLCRTYSNAWHDVFTHMTWLIHKCDTIHSQVWHASFIHVIALSIFLSVSLSHPLPPLTNCQQDFHEFVQPFAVEQLVETRWQR